MQLFDVYPAGAVGGSCFITKDYVVGDGRKVISLDVRLDNLPATGLLCVSQEAVRQMNVILGWDADEQGHQRRKDLEAQVAALEEANAALRQAIANVTAAQALVGDVPASADAIAEVTGVGDPDPIADPVDPNPYENSTKAELLEIAAEAGIKGRSSMNKAQLIEALRAAK